MFAILTTFNFILPFHHFINCHISHFGISNKMICVLGRELVSPNDYHLGSTSRGRPNLICRGYKYVRNVRNVPPKGLHVNTYWRCSRYWSQKCTANVIMNPEGYLLLRKCHNHLPFEQDEASFQRLREYTGFC